MKRISLNGTYSLSFYDDEARRRGLPSPETTIPAVIPGNVEIDLMNAGILPDIYFGNNIKLTKKYEFYNWRYTIKFDLPELKKGETAYLNFEGVDCVADYYLNGVKFADSKNALIGHRFALPKSAKTGENVLEVKIYSPLIYAEGNDNDAYDMAFGTNYESLAVRKAPHEYGWDIMPRLLSAGIWRGVYLETEGENEITELYLSTVNASKTSARIECVFSVKTSVPYYEGLSLKLTGRLSGGEAFVFEKKLNFIKGNFDFGVNSPELWWPLGYGASPVYDVTAELIKDGEVLATRKTTFGIRTVKLVRTDTLDEYGGDFHFEINGEKVFCRGTNWVPLDALHSRDGLRYAPAVDMLKDLNCNMVRCWGGNVYEGGEFFDLCDRSGIMVWQDFAMACAFYPQTDELAKIIEEEATAVVKRVRNHPSVVLWSGDNECDSVFSDLSGTRDPNKNRLTREVLPGVIRRHDPFRFYLPSSPYVSEKALNTSKKQASPDLRSLLPEYHSWGARDYFKSPYYKNLRCAFISETGYHGCNDKNSIKGFISENKLWPPEHNDEWITHATEMNGESGSYAYRIPLMGKQVYELFGVHPDNLDDYIFASQVSQAEAFKYFIENSRQKKWARSGIIWWNLIDGWPQFSDAVVSYDFHKKLAYHYIKQSQQNVMLSFDEPNGWAVRLYIANDSLEEQAVFYEVFDGDTKEKLISGGAKVPENQTIQANLLNLSWSEQRLLIIKWTANGVKGVNHYIHGSPAFSLETMKRWVKIIAKEIDSEDLNYTLSQILPE